MNAYEMIAKATKRAAVEQLLRKGYDVDTIDCDKLTQALMETLKSNLVTMQKEWKDAIDAHVGELMLRQIVNTQANFYAMKANRLAGYL